MYSMAAYQPPTEILPKFNEFVFNEANEPEYLDQLVVHKAGAETITGIKTFTALPVTSITPTTDTQLTNKLYVDNAVSGGLSGYVTLTTPQTISGDKTFTGVETFQNDSFIVKNTAGVDRITTTSTTTTLDNTSCVISAGGSSKITVGTSTTTLNNTTNNFQAGGTTRLQLVAGTTTLNNTTTNIQSGSTNKIVTTGTTTTLSNTTINLQDETPTTRFTQNNGTTTITNANIGTNGILTQTGNFTAKGTTITLQDATPTTRFLQNDGTTTITNANIGTNGILTQTGSATLKGTTITLQDATPTTHFLQNATATTLSNTTINLQDETPTTRFTQNNGATTITNAAITLTGATSNTITTSGKNVMTSSEATGSGYQNDIIATGANSQNRFKSQAYSLFESNQNDIQANGVPATASNRLLTGGRNIITSSRTTAPYANLIEATGTSGINLIDATASLGGNTIRTTTGENLITTTTGTNKMESASTSTSANFIQHTGASGGNFIQTTSGTNVVRTTNGGNSMECIGTGINTISVTSGTNTISSTTGTNIMSSSSSGTNSLVTFTGLNEMRANTSGNNTITTATGRNTLTTAGTNATANLIEATAANGGNTIRVTSATGTNTISATAGGSNTITTTTGTNTISSANTTATANQINSSAGGITLSAAGSSGINVTSTSATGDITITSSRNINSVGTLQHNNQTTNPRRQYSLDYRNGSNVAYYGLEIIRAVNDPNNTAPTPVPTNGKTYIEIFSNGNLDANYNGSRLNGYFIGAANSDAVSQCDFMCSSYDYQEPMFGPIYTGSSGASYTSFVFYLIGGFNYRIITDGVIGNYWNNITTTPLFERWVLTNNTTYNTGATSTFAIMKNLNGTDFLGTTASVFTLAFPALFLDANIYDYTTNRANKFKITDSKIIAPEQYIAAAGDSTAIPVVSFTKIGIKNGGTSSSNINWGLDTVNVALLARLLYRCRCVGVDVVFDNDGSPPAVDIYFKIFLGNSATIGQDAYFDAGTNIRVDTTNWSTTTGWAESAQILSQPTIPSNTLFYGSWECRNVSTNALVTLNQEFIITFYFQQLP